MSLYLIRLCSDTRSEPWRRLNFSSINLLKDSDANTAPAYFRNRNFINKYMKFQNDEALLCRAWINLSFVHIKRNKNWWQKIIIAWEAGEEVKKRNLRWFQLFKIQFRPFLNKKIIFLGFHGVVLVKTFPLMYQLLM